MNNFIMPKNVKRRKQTQKKQTINKTKHDKTL